MRWSHRVSPVGQNPNRSPHVVNLTASPASATRCKLHQPPTTEVAGGSISEPLSEPMISRPGWNAFSSPAVGRVMQEVDALNDVAGHHVETGLPRPSCSEGEHIDGSNWLF